MGVTFLPPEYYPPGTPDLTVNLRRLADGGADYIYLAGTGPSWALAMKDAAKLGMTEETRFVTDFWGVSEITLPVAPEACEGVVGVNYLLGGGEAKANSLYEFVKEVLPPEEQAGLYIHGTRNAVWQNKALKIALDEVGYDALDGDAYKEALWKMGEIGFDADGSSGPCTYSPTERAGSMTVKFLQVQNGKIVTISDWREVPDTLTFVK